MRITIFRDSKYDQDELFGSVAFDMFDMDGGPASICTSVLSTVKRNMPTVTILNLKPVKWVVQQVTQLRVTVT